MKLTYGEINSLVEALNDLQEQNVSFNSIAFLDYLSETKRKLSETLQDAAEVQNQIDKRYAADYTTSPMTAQIQVQEWQDGGQQAAQAERMELMMTEKEVDIDTFPKSHIEEADGSIGFNTYQALKILIEEEEDANSSES